MFGEECCFANDYGWGRVVSIAYACAVAVRSITACARRYSMPVWIRHLYTARSI